jgi:hypothetical protein
MKACDKILATMGRLRDNNVIGMPTMVADRSRAPQKPRGWQGILAEGHRGHLIKLAEVVTSRRWVETVPPRVQARLIWGPASAVTSANKERIAREKGARYADR